MVLRMIQQAALLLRAVFNSLPVEQFESEDELQAMGKTLSENNLLQLDDFIGMTDDKAAIKYLKETKNFDLDNMELLADILATTSNKIVKINPEKHLAYKQKAFLLLSYVSEESKTFEWNRIQKINQLKEELTK